MPPTDHEESRVFRVGGVSYLRIPAQDPHIAAAFYQSVFGWNLRGDPDHPTWSGRRASLRAEGESRRLLVARSARADGGPRLADLACAGGHGAWFVGQPP